MGNKVTKTVQYKKEKADKIMNQINLQIINQNLDNNLRLIQNNLISNSSAI